MGTVHINYHAAASSVTSPKGNYSAEYAYKKINMNKSHTHKYRKLSAHCISTLKVATAAL